MELVSLPDVQRRYARRDRRPLRRARATMQRERIYV
jgi:hypothetical protein